MVPKFQVPFAAVPVASKAVAAIAALPAPRRSVGALPATPETPAPPSLTFVVTAIPVVLLASPNQVFAV